MLLVGERLNTRPPASYLYMNFGRWVKLAPRVPAFPDRPSREKLRSLGVDLDAVRAFNLLPPSPTPGEWDARFAGKVARGLDLSEWDLVAMVGGRVAAAFGVEGPYGPKFGKMVRPGFTVLPHPSGLCRVWNDPSEVRRIRACLSRCLRRVRSRSGATCSRAGSPSG